MYNAHLVFETNAETEEEAVFQAFESLRTFFKEYEELNENKLNLIFRVVEEDDEIDIPNAKFYNYEGENIFPEDEIDEIREYKEK
ncbi:MAG: hypothetical protein ACOC1O_00015 [bacterium]